MCETRAQALLAPLRSLSWSNMGCAGISEGLELEFYGEARLSGQRLPPVKPGHVDHPETGPLDVPMIYLKFVIAIMKSRLMCSFKMCWESTALFSFLNKAFGYYSALLLCISGFLTHTCS